MEEKLMQLVFVAINPSKQAKVLNEELDWVKKFQPGGIIFFKGYPTKQIELTNLLQSYSKIPLLVAIDGEWGLTMRIDSTVNYPKQMMLGAMRNDSLIYVKGCDIAKQLKRMGIHINFAPVVDVNNNPANPIINMRSFGEDKDWVLRKSYFYMKGMEDNRILTSAKHFPGHGDTDADSHLTLPLIKHSFERIDSLELYPFKALIDSGISGIMVAHLNIPSIDSVSNRASSLSSLVVNNLLKKKLGFQGLIYTDALTMKGVTNFAKPGEIALSSFLAGNDIILMPDDIPAVVKSFQIAIQDSLINISDLDERCKKVLLAKQWTGAKDFKPISTQNLIADLNQPSYLVNRKKLTEACLTVLKNEQNIIPLRNLDTLKIACLSIGYDNAGIFHNMTDLYAKADHFSIDKNFKFTGTDSLLNALKSYNLILAAVINTDIRVNRNFGISDSSIMFLDKLARNNNVVLSFFSSPYALNRFTDLSIFKSLVLTYEDKDYIQQATVQLLFGAAHANGYLPVSLNSGFKKGDGLILNEKIRLSYSSPEELGYQSEKFNVIDSIIETAISYYALPGCQVLIAKDASVIYHKSFGKHTYEGTQLVKKSDLYDVASLTKVMATTPAVMRLYETGDIKLLKKVSYYLPELNHTNKASILVKDLLCHQAGLAPFIPFYKKFNSSADTLIYSKYQDSVFTIQVADSMYFSKKYYDSIYTQIIASPLAARPTYKYSDLGFILLQKIIESKDCCPLDVAMYKSLYHPLGATYTTYKPLEKYSPSVIIPTENDLTWRKQLVHGYVHDQTCAMMGGICGHAGLFSNANDIAKIMQMFLNKGVYGGIRYFEEETVSKFTSSQELKKSNRRAYGFDKPEGSSASVSPCSRLASPESYGHSGFTGTFVWVDPKDQLIYIFLSNRVYPDSKVNRLTEMNVRTKIQDEIYKIVRE